MTTVDHGPHAGQLERTLLSHTPMMRHVLRRAGVSEDDEDDALQDALLTAWLLLRDGRFDGENIGAWLATIAFNGGQNYRVNRVLQRRRYEQQELPGMDVAALDASPEAAAMMREELRAIDALPMTPLQRTSVALTAQGLSEREVAARLGVPRGTVFTCMRLARARVREQARRVA